MTRYAWPKDPDGYKRERPTASPQHQALNAVAGPGRIRNVLNYGRQPEAPTKSSFAAAVRALMAVARQDPAAK